MSHEVMAKETNLRFWAVVSAIVGAGAMLSFMLHDKNRSKTVGELLASGQDPQFTFYVKDTWHGEQEFAMIDGNTSDACKVVVDLNAPNGTVDGRGAVTVRWNDFSKVIGRPTYLDQNSDGVVDPMFQQVARDATVEYAEQYCDQFDPHWITGGSSVPIRVAPQP